MGRFSMPHSLCCFQGKEIFLFWNNIHNTDYKNTETKKVTKLSKYILCTYILYTVPPCNRRNVWRSVVKPVKKQSFKKTIVYKCMFWMCSILTNKNKENADMNERSGNFICIIVDVHFYFRFSASRYGTVKSVLTWVWIHLLLYFTHFMNVFLTLAK